MSKGNGSVPDAGTAPGSTQDEDIAAILGHDAFEDDVGAEPTEASEGTTTDEGDQGTAETDGVTRPKAAETDEPSEDEGEEGKEPPAPEEPAEVKALKAQVEKAKPSEEVRRLQEQIADLQKKSEKPAEAAPTDPFQQVAQMYPVQVPDQYMDALFPGLEPEQREPARAVLTHMIQSIATSVHTRVAEQVGTQVSGKLTEGQQATQQEAQVAQQRQQVYDDFYGKYPQLKAVPQTVAAEAQALQAELGGNVPWGSAFRDAVGARVIHKLGQSGFIPKSNGTGQPPPQARPGARPANPGASPEDNLAEDVLG